MKTSKLSPATVSAIDSLESMWSEVDRIKDACFGEVVARPANTFTVREFSKRYNKSESHSLNILNAMARRGEMEKLRAYVPDTTGRMVPTNVYRPATK